MARMKTLELIRHEQDHRHTLGSMKVGDKTLFTLERPWIPRSDGLPGGIDNYSCVPAGTYELLHHTSKRFPDTFALMAPELGVFYPFTPTGRSGRDAVLIHAGNRVSNTRGCILVGLRHTVKDVPFALYDSVKALGFLRIMLTSVSDYQLVIRENFK